MGVGAPHRLHLDFSVFTEEERRTGTGFNFGTARVAHRDLRGTELHGLSAFALDDGVVYHSQFLNSPPPRKIAAITGGTGRYRGARGDLVLTEHPDHRNHRLAAA